ncbi:monofunctional biosynthetic peptidoglycan transglycosylase [Pseudooceanicola sp.]|uniref:monofunctional biosynthetic peptidoglycan transglycosylase n=1 Tax=Pseudooceanicola sp. TaxID=1914328 RepID=UPI0026201762|nr:monofunctional biosynthetic peptidoglycan transglycosylase [Pseudooceanicola sp.]MDF1855079.1 monofunctional biosynthetic peptidoglycan transglycosylase [Pseudooceanicola sp.]
MPGLPRNRGVAYTLRVAKQTKPKAKKKARQPERPRRFRRLVRWVLRWGARLAGLLVLIVLLVVAAHSRFNPTLGYYMWTEEQRLGEIDRVWVPISEIAPAMARSVVAAEDANFCNHWGFDMAAIRAALADGGRRGGSTLTQQVVKNVYLWHGRSWARKALEALLTPVVEILWSKRRIVEVYLNIAEFDEGVFGVEAAARHYFGVGPEALSDLQAARLAAVLPAPQSWSASRPSDQVRNRTKKILSGAATIAVDGRAACFERP